ncbi:MAG: hypothetical protein DYG90_08140 [Chloroflexi bacterium CFX6]|nr:hypothetical protein [Chloroflexi bacterium CFX6]
MVSSVIVSISGPIGLRSPTQLSRPWRAAKSARPIRSMSTAMVWSTLNGGSTDICGGCWPRK